ncbi:MAG: hypothetical protein JJW00_08320 [Sulfurimonas sp.]|nr:hypothetical protein [Sulfurimonas sp.]
MTNNKTILSSVLLVSVLTLSSVTLTPLTASTEIKVKSITSSIATNLQNRGINKDASWKIAQTFLTIDEELFSLMLQNLSSSSLKLNKDKTLHYLSTQALMNKEVDLGSYTYLVGMAQSIKGTYLSKDDLKSLSIIAQKNSFYLNSCL